ncbi:cyclin-L1-1-like isoform X1 [Olea europaea var. sylvestris]|uniref:cyclin-L1-1-like isoform X1 n=3 Tax=Olea europaea var. sylvestris TaxID=158386 RepID=UPI000C1D7246|nr:cyclin-L1-1-like isoform X1 [Olea europaea var. sylvestris]XP_022861240.1 cyclin-L1-1-like isoform X1 [Olea europaea var. sylvestris]XP_022861241.1 cyclin-L1-1-like isoform X1 [Olea europaea var. sylvestris]XP_022861242.1 cyclin-L1-1-like isoform X1 [Olea europaea var. sylvestris]XP_022861243.1 cyclin-L1-1-like isoform X1 [Olea europaea var. sylvestris]XP_022861244.1 cyclin-L1-1-like isoform X1 [Olea europaea var. sylvestris]XP_022861245.1 cyclin-L1-1-like isoform X1 [Olea europaea var. sy
MTLRIYGCDLIQESGILLKLPQAVMATGQVLFHRFFCKKSFARFNVKRVAASCVWLASKLEESPRKARQVFIVFHRMECRRENLPIEHLDTYSKKYVVLKVDLIRTERHLLKEMGFICHVEHPNKFISNYLATLGTPPVLRQEAWNLANDSLHTTLCVRFKSEVVACGVVYAAARRFQVSLPESPPWWKAFDADKSGIDEVCRVLAHLYTLPKAHYIPVCKERGLFSTSNRSWDSPHEFVAKDRSLTGPAANEDSSTAKGSSSAANQEVGKDVLVKAAYDKIEELKSADDSKSLPTGEESRKDSESKLMSDHRTEVGGESNKGRDRDRVRNRDRDTDREKERTKSRDHDRGRESDKEQGRADSERERDKVKERVHHSRDKGKDSGRFEKLKHHSSRDREYHSSSYSSREDRRKHHSYA